jgi:uncharacterized protein
MNLDKHRFLFFSLIFLTSIPCKGSEQPSFPCEKAETEEEKKICSSSILSFLDKSCDEKYRALLKFLSHQKKEKLIKEQRK